jgi:hypothetical protein
MLEAMVRTAPTHRYLTTGCRLSSGAVTRRSWLLSAFIAIGLSAAAQPQAPGDLESDAAYCLGAMQAAPSPVNDTDPECNMSTVPNYVAACRKSQQMSRDAIRADQQTIQRLQGYLATKGFGTTPSTSLQKSEAVHRGKADGESWKARIDSREGWACINRCLYSPDCIEKCAKELDTDGVRARLARCEDVLKALPD